MNENVTISPISFLKELVHTAQYGGLVFRICVNLTLSALVTPFLGLEGDIAIVVKIRLRIRKVYFAENKNFVRAP